MLSTDLELTDLGRCDPPHADVLIGPVALRHREDLLERVLPEVSQRLREFDVVVRFGFLDDDATVRAMDRLGEILAEFGRVNTAMRSAAYTSGEA